MATTTHRYPVRVEWRGGRTGTGSIVAERSGQAMPIGVPPEFGGQGEGTNPEELLTAAIAGCYTITFGIVAANRKLPVLGVETTVEGEVDQTGAQFAYARVTLRPRITLAEDATDAHLAQARDMAHKADAYCIVTNAVRGKVQVSIEAEVVRAGV